MHWKSLRLSSLQAVSAVVLSKPAKVHGNLDQLLRQDLVLDNATFRLVDVAPCWTRYLVLAFRASAVSDDKRDWMVREVTK